MQTKQYRSNDKTVKVAIDVIPFLRADEIKMTSCQLRYTVLTKF